MKKVLFYCDSPTVITGFGNVARNIINQIRKTEKYEINVCGINYYGDPYDRNVYPYPIWPAMAVGKESDVYGRNRFLELIGVLKPEIVFLLQDTFIVETFMSNLLKLQEMLKFKTIYYFPIDSNPKKSWVENVVKKMNYSVTYTNYAKKLCNMPELPIIYHGTDKSVFKPVDATEFRKAIFGEVASKFIVLNVNRNQPRKDLHKTFEAFAKFKKLYQNSYLYIVAQLNDAGGDLREIADQYGLRTGQDWNCPPANLYRSDKGIPETDLNLLYNSCDLVTTTTLGEGWGLSITESFACKKPVLAPRNTSLEEIIGENQERGTFIAKGGNICLGLQDNNRVRPVVDTTDMADKMLKIAKKVINIQKKVDKAFEWVPSWDDVGIQWADIFDKASKVE